VTAVTVVTAVLCAQVPHDRRDHSDYHDCSGRLDKRVPSSDCRAADAVMDGSAGAPLAVMAVSLQSQGQQPIPPVL
jgi:hypothetical protein